VKPPAAPDLLLVLSAIHDSLCEAERLNQDGQSRVDLARKIANAIELCKYLKQPEWDEAVERLRVAAHGPDGARTPA